MLFLMRQKGLFITLAVIVFLIMFKVIWVWCYTHNLDNFESEKEDILKRRNFLLEKVIVAPTDLLNSAPDAIGAQFQGEWALYSCSMLTKALKNISLLYPETKKDNLIKIDSIIEIALSQQIRQYDWHRWNEDPLEELSKEGNGHLSYLSHVAWMIGNYKFIGGSGRYDSIYDNICETLYFRINNADNLCLPTYPGEPIYLPDMLVAIVALKEYGDIYNNRYRDLVERWLEKTKTEWIDAETGLMKSYISEEDDNMPVRGSYSALNCYYLTQIDDDFALDQYSRLKDLFSKDRTILSGIKEFHDKSPFLAFDVDAGIILTGLSPSGTAFAVGCATYFDDREVRNKLLKTAETAGHSVSSGNKTHYLLADIALVGEAIMLAMRTTCRVLQ